MKQLSVFLAVVGLYGLYAQCASCAVSGSPTLPQGFDPSSITLTVGRDTEVVIQFTLPDTAQPSGFTVYPNYAIYVDSLRMAGGNTYVVVKGTASTPVSYGNGAFAFDQAPRYKQVQSGASCPGGGVPQSLPFRGGRTFGTAFSAAGMCPGLYKRCSAYFDRYGGFALYRPAGIC
jgi:hypothetical protein